MPKEPAKKAAKKPAKKQTKKQAAKAKGRSKARENAARKKAGQGKKPGPPTGRKRRKKKDDYGPFASMETLAQARDIAELRLKGKTFRQIAEAFDLHHSTVQEAFYTLMGWTEGEAQETAQQVREEEGRRLEDLYNRALDLADEATSIQGPDGVTHEDPGARVRALATALKISESKRKLHGVDEPDKHEHLGKDGAALILAGEVAAKDDEEIERELAGFMAGAASAEGLASKKRRKKRHVEEPVADAPEPEPEGDPEARGEPPKQDPVPEPETSAQTRGKSLF